MNTQDDTSEIMAVEELLAYKNPESDKIVIDAARGTCTLNFDYSYEVDLDRIKTERDLLFWVRQLTGKPWMTPLRLKMFIDRVCAHKGFSVRR